MMLLAKNYNNYLIKLIKSHINSSDVIVDFGAGLGNFAESLSGNGHKVVCIEADDEFRENLKKRGFACFKTLDELDDDSVDLLYSLNVLDHIENDYEIIEKIYSKIKVGRNFDLCASF
ncbi:MAG: methyltransferase domain-containing protein [Nitrososphaeria archaeon]